MSSSTAIHVLTRAAVEAENRELPFDDPDGVAALTPQKRQALLANPLSASADDPMQLIGTCDGRAIGRIDLVAGRFVVRGEDVPVHFGSNWFVRSEQRGSLMGLMLLVRMQQLGAALAAFGPSQVAVQIYQKLGWKEISLPRYIMLRHSRPVVMKYLGGRLGARIPAKIAAGLCDAVLAAHGVVLGTAAHLRTHGLQLQRAQAMPAELDEFLPAAEPVSCHRSAAWVNWLLNNSFVHDARNKALLYLVHGRGGRIVGYILLKVRFYPVATHRGFQDVLLGSIQDWIIFDHEAMGMWDVVLLGVRALAAQGVDAIEICAKDGDFPGGSSRLRMLGFVRVGTMHMMYKPVPGSRLDDPQLHNADSWRIRPGDGEAFFA